MCATWSKCPGSAKALEGSSLIHPIRHACMMMCGSVLVFREAPCSSTDRIWSSWELYGPRTFWEMEHSPIAESRVRSLVGEWSCRQFQLWTSWVRIFLKEKILFLVINSLRSPLIPRCPWWEMSPPFICWGQHDLGKISNRKLSDHLNPISDPCMIKKTSTSTV